jgi:hypothetical protein
MSTKAKLTDMRNQLGQSKEKPEKEKIKAPSDPHIPRGERADFLKITVTIPAEMLTELRALGMKRKANKMKDTDTSSLIREALGEFLKKYK